MTGTAVAWISRFELFDTVGSTNNVVADWLRDGTPEVCVAVADRQSAGRGRNGRTWTSTSGAALLCSLGFRPTYLEPAQQWRLAAIVSMAMAGAIEATAGLQPGTVELKWPNDLVVRFDGGRGAGTVRKLAGVLGETRGAGTDDPQAVIGIGVNVDWDPAAFPDDLAPEMTSMTELAPARRVHPADLYDSWILGLAPMLEALRAGSFPGEAWRARQLTNGSVVRLERPDGITENVRAVDVDPSTGALVIKSLVGESPARSITVGEIRHLRLAEV